MLDVGVGGYVVPLTGELLGGQGVGGALTGPLAPVCGCLAAAAR